MIKYITYGLFILLSIACNKTNQSDSKSVIEITKSNQLEANLEIDSVCIKLDSVSLSYYFKNIGVMQNDSDFYFIAYNSKTNSLDCFDLNKKSITHTPIKESEKYGISHISSIYPVNKDSIFLWNYNMLLLTNINGTIINTYSTSVISNNHKGLLFADISSRPYYDRINKEFYSVVKYENWENSRKEPVAVKYSLIDSKYEFLPIYFTDEYIEKYKELGYLKDFQISFGKKQIVYNYNYSPVVYQYEYSNKTNSIIQKKESSVSNTFGFIDNKASDERKTEHFITNHIYNSPHTNINNNKIYQTIWLAAKDKITDKRTVLTSIDLTNNTFEENLLKHKYVPKVEFTTQKGLLLLVFDDSDNSEKKIEFHLLKQND